MLAPYLLKVAKAEFDHMLRLGIIRPSDSCWSSPLQMVPQKTLATGPPCGDYRALNNITVHDRYPVPHIHDFTVSFHGKCIDLVRPYHQIPVKASDIQKTAVYIPLIFLSSTVCPLGYAMLHKRSNVSSTGSYEI